MFKRLLSLWVLMLALCINAAAQERTVTGSVVENGQPLPGVTVLVKGTSQGSITDFNGQFSILASEQDVLVFSFVGYLNQEIQVGTKSTINVSLEQDVEQLEEVVVTAMGQQTDKKSIGYAFQEVQVETLQQAGNPGLAGALQGKVSGVDIKPSSGMPGASTQINIRGARSFTGNNAPLYVVDGMPISSNPDFSTGSSVTGADVANRAVDIDPNDIASINILKGQAAAALYGIRASNGVIIIETKSGKGGKNSKPVVNISNSTSFDVVSRSPEYQTTYAQGAGGVFNPYQSMGWGPKISDIPNDINTDPEKPTGPNGIGYGGNHQGHPGKYFVPQLEHAGMDPWVTPGSYDNFGDYFGTGYTINTSANISQSTDNVNYSVGISNVDQKGIAPNTGMGRWNAKARFDATMNDHFSAGASANYVQSEIDKLSAGNDAALAGVYAAPPSYNLKGIPSANPTDPYDQIYYRSLTFPNPYWAAENNVFNEKTDRFYGNAYLQYETKLRDNMDVRVKYQLGIDAYTSHYQDIFEYGNKGIVNGIGGGSINNYGVSNNTLNSLATVNFNWDVTSKSKITAIVGNELNDQTKKTYDQYGSNFNGGGWKHITNTQVQSMNETQRMTRTVGFFGSLTYSYDQIFFLTATGRNDFVSTMPRNNRSFFYPSISTSVVLSEMDFLNKVDELSLFKVRASFAQVGQAGDYYENFYSTPSYGGGWWSGEYPINYPMNGITGFNRSGTLYDPALKPQNTMSFEVGTDLGFFNDRIVFSYTYSYQDVKDQIFAVPLAKSTGYSQKLTNGGRINTNAHEINLTLVPIQKKDLRWDMTFNYSKIVSVVQELAPGVESIFLGGFVTPQVRAAEGFAYPVIYGSSYLRDDNDNIIVDENGLPMMGDEEIIGDVTPDFILGFNTSLQYKNWNLSAVFDWKHGGEMYSGTNGLMDFYGMSKRTENRDEDFVFEGVKEDGTPNDIVIGPNGAVSHEGYYNRQNNINESFIYDNSFIKLRELAIGYQFPEKVFNGTTGVRLSAFARNILLWSKLPNLDPESSQGNNNMGGSFERFSMPNTSSFGFGVDLTF
ncbi:SusC/RagA family TonB-linked outer membrane protein [Flammeovirga yaeyamensis]|uniref:SusC/RagA family TonB-linked outer membrane protein n=1 Tax=Flammeovirga yaeyamensis TaxID=367791 RepID=A0AAX1N646_9BACT|nr:SusC/RagA family TonB-linked outer membrane protein [Flammeovirga yaeyamensis]MBB3701053.1 TonB-linked SusC/RagA family outer membrane protein [Flammeovirga yaeyamensis]NMF38115.1 SusC/RagA family TonB-linked outer membrane protein [Flammeovirga yaeyamensis]QWG01886.1 SusC/RagA family TonB-linked outer membrane protein [Flammeovirga yaeyamensis]